MDISKKIKQLLIEKDLTGTQLAAAIGISQSYFSKKIRNNDWTIQDLEKIAQALNVKFEATFILENGTEI